MKLTAEQELSRRELLTGKRREIRIVYDPRLTEEAVFLELKRREEEGEGDLLAEYYRFADPLYALPPGEEREERFARLHLRFFRRLGFERVLTSALAEFPLLEARTEELFVGKALTPLEERGTLVSRNAAKVRIGLRLRPVRFLDVFALQKYLRHELLHASDMADEEFAYAHTESIPDLSLSQQNLIRDRYRVLWDIYIDGRLTRQGKETVADKEDRYREFSALYLHIPPSDRETLFSQLWQAEGLTHGEILAMAKDVDTLLARAGVNPWQQGKAAPGSLCPLCRFPTYFWGNRMEERIIALIREDFPDWEPQEGACERCIEIYVVRAGGETEISSVKPGK